jgi:hypothetical protein
MLAGAAGHTYGNHNIWQFLEPNRKPISFARTHWKKALEQPGALQMGHMRKLFESRPWQKLLPDQSLLADAAGEGADHIRSARAEDGSFLFAYSPTGKPLRVKLNVISGSQVKAFWFDPRAGTNTVIGEFKNAGTQKFAPPSSGREDDWVLVLDDAARKFPNPGGTDKE